MALYEMLGVAALAGLVRGRWRAAPGARFAAFMAGYCALRLAVDGLKPPFGPAAEGTLPVSAYAGLSAIQWLALSGIVGYALLFRHRRRAAAPSRDPQGTS